MATTNLQRLRTLLAAERPLALLLPQARRLTELQRRLERCVPPGVARACRVVAVHGDTVSIHCRYGAAAARLRSQAQTLAEALGTPADPVRQVKVRVRADWDLRDRAQKAGMDAAALAAWDGLARRLPAGELRQAVERLLAHHRG
ncbi:MAG: DUF721 domain-containing protein [Thiobacillaceae bacterium]|nr:DUF721 domain-containing protein [Thiobacillaceae bacterium]